MPISNPKEEIDIRILRLIGLEDVFDLDYDTYLTLLKEAIVRRSFGNKKLADEELALLSNERKRVRGNTGRFQLKPKKIGVGSFNVGTAKKLITPSKGGALVSTKAISKSPLSKGLENSISQIASSVVSISETLRLQKKVSDDAAAYDKKKAEREKRGLLESNLEKRFEGLKRTAEKIIAPVKSLLDRILNFIGTIILGRIVFKLIEWLGDKKNADKVKSIIRFFKDNWPKLLSLYIVFGTSFGKFARGLISLVVRGTAGLLKATAGLAAKVIGGKLGGRLGKVAGFLGGKKGKLAVAGVEALATVGGTLALSKSLENFGGIGGEEQKTQKFSGGGLVVPRFSGGGFNFFKDIFGGMFSGLVRGPGGSRGDKIPAMLSNGEFVVSAGAVQKYGVDTFEAMNAAGGGDNKPKIMGGTTYAAGGGLVGDIPLASSYGVNPDDNALRRAARTFKQYGTEEDLFKAFKKLNGVPDIPKMVGGENNFSRIFQGQYGADDALDAIRKSVSDKLKAVINPQSFTQSSRAAAGLDDLAKKFDIDAKTAPRYAENLPRLGRPKPKVTRIDASRMLPSAGQSSANAMRAAAKAAQNVRAPIPASSAIVPYTGGGLARTGVTAGLSVPQIKNNMRVPGGFGNLKSLGVELLLSYLVQSGLDYVEAKRLASTIEKARKESPEKLANRIQKLRELVEKEERYQKSFGGILDKVIKMGGETGSERLSRQARTILGGLGANAYQGGAIKGGYGLKQQSFKDMPKTQIMTDDKGRPFVGYKAMRGGKPVYVRGPQPGQGTSNPFEALGRMINPGAYKDIDSLNMRKKYQEASSSNISSLKARGASQATIAKTKAQLAKTKPPARVIKPRPKPKPYVAAGGGMGGGRGSKGSKPNATKTPSFSASASNKNSKAKMSILGITI